MIQKLCSHVDNQARYLNSDVETKTNFSWQWELLQLVVVAAEEIVDNFYAASKNIINSYFYNY